MSGRSRSSSSALLALSALTSLLAGCGAPGTWREAVSPGALRPAGKLVAKPEVGRLDVTTVDVRRPGDLRAVDANMYLALVPVWPLWSGTSDYAGDALTKGVNAALAEDLRASGLASVVTDALRGGASSELALNVAILEARCTETFTYYGLFISYFAIPSLSSFIPCDYRRTTFAIQATLLDLAEGRTIAAERFSAESSDAVTLLERVEEPVRFTDCLAAIAPDLRTWLSTALRDRGSPPPRTPEPVDAAARTLVEGRSEDPTWALTINGRRVECDPTTGAYSARVPVDPERPGRVTIVATDTQGVVVRTEVREVHGR